MRKMLVVALWLWSLRALGTDIGVESALTFTAYPVSPVSAPQIKRARAGATAAIESLADFGQAVRQGVGGLPSGVGVEMPGIVFADEYSETLLAFDPQAAAQPAEHNKGGCWFSNAQQLANIVVASRAGDALPSSPPVELELVCMQASSVQVLPAQSGRRVRSWAAALLRGSGMEPLPIGLIADVVPQSIPIVDSQFQTQASGDGLHRVAISMRIRAYYGDEFQREQPRHGGRIAVRDVGLLIHSAPLAY